MDTENSRKQQHDRDDEWLTVSEVADRLRCHEQSIRKQILSGKLPAIQIGSTYRIRMSDLPDALAVR